MDQKGVMGLDGFRPSTLKVGIGRCLSPSVIKQRLPFVLAVDSCTNLTRFHLVFATLLPPSLASWIASSLASTGKRACFTLTISSAFSSTWEEHLVRLRQVFERLRHANLKLGAEKCTFAAKEVSYLGHRATEEGLLPDSSLLAAIREIPPPKTATEVRSFLGLAGYYRGAM